MELVERWRSGSTEMPLIDALMRELKATGFMSNRGRQIVAAYLTLDLRQDWRMGAYHFEEYLIDHDVQSNYASWNFAAGIGPSKTLNFNILGQSQKFDAKGKFIRKWVPELHSVPLDYLHDPWNMNAELQEASGFTVGKDYPKPIPCEKYTSKAIAATMRRSKDNTIVQLDAF